MKKDFKDYYVLFFANIPTIIFIIFCGFCLVNNKDVYAFFSFLLAIYCARIFKTKD